MDTLELVLGIVLLVCAVFLVIAVLMQHGKAKNLSGTITGGAETFFGKTKGKAIDKVLSKATTVVSIVFVLIVIAMYAVQPDINYGASVDFGLSGAEGYEGVVTTAASTVSEPAETTAGEPVVTGDGISLPSEEIGDEYNVTTAASTSVAE